MTKLHICADAREFTGRGNTGIGRYLQNLLVPLASDPGMRLTCCIAHDGRLPAALDGQVETVKLPDRPTLLLDQYFLPRIATQRRADWFFSPYYKTPLHGSFRKIITVHDIMFLRMNADPPLKRRLASWQLRLAAHSADIVLTDSDFTTADLADYLSNIRPKIRRVYPDLGPEWFEPARDDGTSPCRERQAYFLYVGNFKPHKNIDLLIRAFADWQSRASNARHNLILAGTDPVRAPDVLALIERAGLTQRIKIETEVSEPRLRELYRSADWLATASGYEGFGYPIVEAFATGCPVICHRGTSLAEIAGDAALFIPALTTESIAATLQTAAVMPPDHRRDFTTKGRRQARLFKPGAAAAAFLRQITDSVPI